MNNREYINMFELEETHFWFVSKRMFIEKYLAPVKSVVSAILDIGSGTGGTTKWLGKYGTVVGLEKSLRAATLGRKRGIRIIVGNAHKLPFKNSRFNLITLFDVLYHQQIFDIDVVLRETHRVLKSHGHILITDSALPFLYSKHDQHLFGKRRFTINQLEKHLLASGFTVIKSSYIFFSIFPLLLIKRKVFDFFSHPKESEVGKVNKLANQLLISVLQLESILLPWVSFPIGSSVIILARKNK